MKHKKEVKGQKLGRVYLSLFEDNTIVYVEKHEKSTNKFWKGKIN